MKKIAANRNYRIINHKKIASNIKYKLAAEKSIQRGPNAAPSDPNLRMHVPENIVGKRDYNPLSALSPLTSLHTLPFDLMGGDAAIALMKLGINFAQLKTTNVKYSDKYFHCLGHCAASGHIGGGIVSEIIGEGKERIDALTKSLGRHSDSFQGDSLDIEADKLANHLGRLSQKHQGNCGWCYMLIPNGLPEKYWVLPEGWSVEQARPIIKTHTSMNEEFILRQGDRGQILAIREERERGLGEAGEQYTHRAYPYNIPERRRGIPPETPAVTRQQDKLHPADSFIPSERDFI